MDSDGDLDKSTFIQNSLQRKIMSLLKTVNIGWAETDITPQELPVYIAGQFYIRVSEGIQDPLKATALALESNGEHVVFVSVDTVSISDPLRDAVRAQLNEAGLDPQKVILNATHTHEAPNNRLASTGVTSVYDNTKEEFDLGFKPAQSYVTFAAQRIAEAVALAWRNRAPGGVAFGQDYAVIGRSRRWVDNEGNATMYGLNEDTAGRFDHIEGYEDHSLNLLATYDKDKNLTGVIVNVPSPAQESMHAFEISADFWCETRQELRRRFGEKLYILPQCSAAGELTSALIFEGKPHVRMLELRGRTMRQEVAARIADAAGRVLPYIASTATAELDLRHEYQTLQLPLNALSEADVEDAANNAKEWQQKYEEEKKKILDNPALKNEPRWYVPLTTAFNRARWYRGVMERYEKSKTQPHYPAEVHVVRLGEIAFATNPFEYYLDFGIQIKVKSPALQTFIVQLAGSGTYVPSARAAAGGGYGAVPASNPVGSEGGQVLADETVRLIQSLWQV
jgi:hypothetical protein